MRFSRGREFRIAQREFWRTAEACSENKFINHKGHEGTRRKAAIDEEKRRYCGYPSCSCGFFFVGDLGRNLPRCYDAGWNGATGKVHHI
jgi:hypothetical protein